MALPFLFAILIASGVTFKVDDDGTGVVGVVVLENPKAQLAGKPDRRCSLGRMVSRDKAASLASV